LFNDKGGIRSGQAKLKKKRKGTDTMSRGLAAHHILLGWGGGVKKIKATRGRKKAL